MENNPNPPKYNYSYGKRPLWQWILIYLAVGVIVYGLIYYFYIAKSGGYNYGVSQYQQNQAGQK